jgi:hypothetical protein
VTVRKRERERKKRGESSNWTWLSLPFPKILFCADRRITVEFHRAHLELSAGTGHGDVSRAYPTRSRSDATVGEREEEEKEGEEAEERAANLVWQASSLGGQCPPARDRLLFVVCCLLFSAPSLS